MLVGTAVNAHADVSYTLGANGGMYYQSSGNKLTIYDYKSGDRMYVRYGYTGVVCGSVGDVCAPDAYATISRASTGEGSTTYDLPRAGGTYTLFKLCQDDTPPDTCSQWKRSGS